MVSPSAASAAAAAHDATALMPAWQPPGEQFWIVDLGSTNGTLVNGEPIQEKELNHGDRITIGQNAVHFSVLGG